MEPPTVPIDRLGRALKRALDLLGASLLLICLSPLLLAVAVIIRWSLGSPIFFRQIRIGLRGSAFMIWKFRSMREAVDSTGRPLPDAQRLTPFGSLLRKTSLDELPQLLNVLRGEMSLVGPRPLLPQYLARYTPQQARRHEVPPGITGWCQIHGRNTLSWDQKFRLDVWYVDHWNLPLDLYILLHTIVTALRRDGISHAQEATMPEFLGTQSPKHASEQLESCPLSELSRIT